VGLVDSVNQICTLIRSLAVRAKKEYIYRLYIKVLSNVISKPPLVISHCPLNRRVEIVLFAPATQICAGTGYGYVTGTTSVALAPLLFLEPGALRLCACCIVIGCNRSSILIAIDKRRIMTRSRTEIRREPAEMIGIELGRVSYRIVLGSWNGGDFC
jgi:hypothetical protein